MKTYTLIIKKPDTIEKFFNRWLKWKNMNLENYETIQMLNSINLVDKNTKKIIMEYEKPTSEIKIYHENL